MLEKGKSLIGHLWSLDLFQTQNVSLIKIRSVLCLSPVGKEGEGKDLTLRQVFYLNSEATKDFISSVKFPSALLPQATCKG